jgi:hypothetical protein
MAVTFEIFFDWTAYLEKSGKMDQAFSYFSYDFISGSRRDGKEFSKKELIQLLDDKMVVGKLATITEWRQFLEDVKILVTKGFNEFRLLQYLSFLEDALMNACIDDKIKNHSSAYDEIIEAEGQLVLYIQLLREIYPLVDDFKRTLKIKVSLCLLEMKIIHCRRKTNLPRLETLFHRIEEDGMPEQKQQAELYLAYGYGLQDQYLQGKEIAMKSKSCDLLGRVFCVLAISAFRRGDFKECTFFDGKLPETELRLPIHMHARVGLAKQCLYVALMLVHGKGIPPEKFNRTKEIFTNLAENGQWCQAYNSLLLSPPGKILNYEGKRMLLKSVKIAAIRERILSLQKQTSLKSIRLDEFLGLPFEFVYNAINEFERKNIIKGSTEEFNGSCHFILNKA